MVSIMRSGKLITGRFRIRGKIRLRVEVDSVEGRGDY